MAMRVVAQRVSTASLLVDNISRTVTIRDGVVLYVSFIGEGFTEAAIDAAALHTVNAKIFSLPPRAGKLQDDQQELPDRQQEPPSGSPRCSGAPIVVSIVDSSADLLIIPQASLAGKLNGRRVQYHAQTEKETALRLYDRLCSCLRAALLPREVLRLLDGNGCAAPTSSTDSNGKPVPGEALTPSGWVRRVYNGTYGNRQGLRLETDGPFTHMFEFTA